jgi:polysaccharide biosynthesis protein PslE
MDLLNEARFEHGSEAWTQFLPTLWKHKLIIVLVFVFTVLSAYATLEIALNDRYDSVAKLLIKVGRENSEAPPTVQNPAFITQGVRQEDINSEVQMLTAQNIVERVVDKLGPDSFKFEPPPPKTTLQKVKYHVKKAGKWVKGQYKELLYATNLKKHLTDREAAIVAVTESLSVDREKDSDVISLKVGLPVPELGVRVADTLLDFYLDDHIKARRADNAKEFFDVEVAKQRERLSETDDLRDKLRSDWGISSVEDQRKFLLERLNEAKREIDRNESERAEFNSQQAVLRASIADLPDTLLSNEVTNPNPVAESLRQRLSTLRVDRAVLASRYTEGAEIVQKSDEEIASVEALLKKEEQSQIGSKTSAVNPTKQKFNEDLHEIEAKAAGAQVAAVNYRRVADSIQEQLDKLQTGEEELDKVDRDRRIAEQTYLAFLKRSQDASVSQELDLRRVSNISVLAPPSLPIEIAYPPKVMVMGIALGGGLLLGIGMALLVEYMRQSVVSADDLRAIEGIPFLGTFQLEKQSGGSSDNLPVKSLLSKKRETGVL